MGEMGGSPIQVNSRGVGSRRGGRGKVDVPWKRVGCWSMKWGGAAPLPLSAVDKLTAVSDDQTMAKNGLARIVISRGLASGCYLVNTEHRILWKRLVRMPPTTIV